MTAAEARERFFDGPIVVQIGSDPDSHNAGIRLFDEIRKIPQAKVELAELDESAPFGPTVYHMGDIITGWRLEDFVSYARWLGQQ